MKKYLLIILLFVSASAIGQQKIKYAERLNQNGTIDSFYVKQFTDSVFNYSNDAFISFTVEHYTKVFGDQAPAGMGNFHPVAGGGFKNYTPRAEAVAPSGIDGISTVGTNLLVQPNPASVSLQRINSDGTVGTRTLAQVITDLGIDQKQDISTNTGGWMVFTVTGANATTTGQVLVDITGLVSGTLANATKYEVEAILDVGTSAVTTGCQYAIQTGGTGSAGVVSSLIIGTTTTNAAAIATLSAPNTAQGTFLTTSNGSGTITMRGWVTTRGTGTATISIQHLKITSGTSTVRIGSKMRIRLAQ